MIGNLQILVLYQEKKEIKQKLISTIILIVFCFGKLFCQYHADKEAYNDVFELKIELDFDSLHQTLIRANLINISNQEQLISLSKNSAINESRDIFFSTSYSHITDPLFLPKLEMPWYLLKPNEALQFTEMVSTEEVKKVTFLMDFLPKEMYPYKRLRKGKKKRRYWFVRNFEEESEKVFTLLLKRYYQMFFENQEIKNFYREIELK